MREAFNSPFWPFVLATTSVGQEGLDFHQYCHAVVHFGLQFGLVQQGKLPSSHLDRLEKHFCRVNGVGPEAGFPTGTGGGRGSLSVRSIRRFMGGDYLGTVLFMATGTLLPVLILARLGKAQAGYFASAYLIIYALDLVTVNLGVALMVEGAMDRSLLRHHAATVVRRILAIIGPAVAVLVLFAPRVLGVFGDP